MHDTVIRFINNREICQKAKTPKHKNRGLLEHIQFPSVPMHQLSMDFLQIDTRAASKVNILVVVDEFTKFAWGILVKTDNAKATANKLYRELYRKFGIPTVVHTDRGKTFVSRVIQLLDKIKHTTTTLYRPQSNATCERLNDTIISRLRSLPANQKHKWNLHVDSLIFAYNSTVHKSTGMSPYFVMFGRHRQFPHDLLVNIPEENKDNTLYLYTYSYVDERREETKLAFGTCADK